MSNQRPSGVVLCLVLAQGQHAAAMQPNFPRCGWFVGVAFSEIAAPVPAHNVTLFEPKHRG